MIKTMAGSKILQTTPGSSWANAHLNSTNGGFIILQVEPIVSQVNNNIIAIEFIEHAVYTTEREAELERNKPIRKKELEQARKEIEVLQEENKNLLNRIAWQSADAAHFHEMLSMAAENNRMLLERLDRLTEYQEEFKKALQEADGVEDLCPSYLAYPNANEEEGREE